MLFNKIENALTEIGPLIHQAALNPHLSQSEIEDLCDASQMFNFSGFCTNLSFIPIARKRLGSSNKTKLIAVIAFPFGCIPSFHKKAEAEWALSEGAEELEVVPNFYALRQFNTDAFGTELSEICELGIPVRVVLDMANLSKEELIFAINIAIEAGVSGIQNGNGFGNPVESNQINLLNKMIKGRCELKAVGGIKSLKKTQEVIQSGASSLGTTMGAEIMEEFRENSN